MATAQAPSRRFTSGNLVEGARDYGIYFVFLVVFLGMCLVEPKFRSEGNLINLLRQKPHRFANLVYTWCLERVDPDKLDEWKAELVELLPWQNGDSEAAIARESESFYALMAAGGGG